MLQIEFDQVNRTLEAVTGSIDNLQSFALRAQSRLRVRNK